MRFAGWTLSALLLAGTVFAQQGPPAGVRAARTPNLQALKTFLNLSDVQVTNLKAVQTALRAATEPIHQQLAAKRQALRAENQKATPDPTVVAQLKQDITSLLDQIATQRTNFQKQAQSYLNPDQLASLAKLEEALKLVAVAREAVALDLITPPEGAGAGMFGLGGPGAFSPMMRRRGAR